MLATVYLFGPLIDAPSHPDTVLTSLLYTETSLGELGITCANLSIDMQLYMVGQQVKWWEPDRFKDVILWPGAMHIIMSFLGYIGTLIKGSGPDTLVGAAFGGLTRIMSGNVKVMRAFSLVSAAQLENFMQANENNQHDNSWHILKMRWNTRQEGTGWITFWCQRSWLISFFGQSERGKLALPTIVHWTYDTLLLQCGSHPLCLLYHLTLAGDAAPSTWQCQGPPHCRSTCLPP